MFLTSANFNAYPYQLPNLSEEDDAADFQSFIDATEEKYLKEILGLDLYNALALFMEQAYAVWAAGTSYDTGAKVEYADKLWTSLVDNNLGNAPEEGANWEEDEEGTRWVVLKNGGPYQDGNDKTRQWLGMVELLKPLVYSERLRDNEETSTASGVVRAELENGRAGDARPKIVDAWNAFVVVAGNSCTNRNTLYGYLYYSGELYGDSIGGYSTIQEYLTEETIEQETLNEFDL